MPAAASPPPSRRRPPCRSRGRWPSRWSRTAACRRRPATNPWLGSRTSRIAIAAAAIFFGVALVIVARHAPPIRETADGAILELYTLQALKGRLLVGPYSRFGWHHPGPLYFYLQAPWYWASGLRTLGMQAGAFAINAGAFALLAW